MNIVEFEGRRVAVEEHMIITEDEGLEQKCGSEKKHKMTELDKRGES